MKKLLLLATLAMTLSLQAAVEYGNRTHYSLRQHDTGLMREHSVWHQHTTNDVGNPHGLSIQLTPFLSFATDRRGLGKQFGRSEAPDITITSDRNATNAETNFPYHSIVHNTTGTTETEESAALHLKPGLTQAGALLSLFHDGNTLAPGLTFHLSMPIVHVKSKVVMHDATPPITTYFDGTYSQEDPIQRALSYGTFTSEKQTALGPVTAQVGFNVIETDRSFAGIQAGFSIATLSPKAQHTLFSAHTANYDHHKLILGLDAGSILWEKEDMQLELLCSARLFYLFAGTEKRILGAYDDDGAEMVASSYRLAGQEGAHGLFPLANVLHRNISVAARHQLETNVMAAVSCKGWTGNVGYGLFAREADKVTVHEWDEGMYSIAHSSYPTTEAFTTGDATHTFGRRHLTRDMLNTITAESPAQVSITLSAAGGYASPGGEMPYTLGAGVSYEHGIVNAAPSMLTVWLKASLSF